MAEPLRHQYDDDSSGEPVTRPNLRAHEGGGETTERKSGHLRSVDDEDSGDNTRGHGDSEGDNTGTNDGGSSEQSGEGEAEGTTKTPEEIKRAEEGFSDTSGDGGAAGGSEAASWSYRSEKGGLGRGRIGNSAKKKYVVGGAGISLILLMLLATLLMFIASLKHIHYATVLRSVGFAGTQLVMRNTFSQIAYESSILSAESTGRISAPERTMLDRLRGVNPKKTMQFLGQRGDFNVIQEGTGNIKGFEIQGKEFQLDDFANKSFPDKGGYDKLSLRERWTVNNDIVATTGNSMSDLLEAEGRSFRNGFFKGFEQHFNIRTSKWANKARDLLGKSPKEAAIETKTKNVEAIEGTDSGVTDKVAIDDAKEAAEESKSSRLKDIKNGIDKRGKTYVNEGLEKAGIKDVAGLSDTLSKVSTGVLVATLYCTARDINNSINEINAEKEKQMQAYAHDIQTTSDQITRGDVNAVAVNEANAEWDSKDGIPSAGSSPFYLASTGRSADNLSQDSYEGIPTGKIDNSKFNTAFGLIDGALVGPVAAIPGGKEAAINAACGGILNPGVQITIAGVDVIASLVAAAASGGTSAAIEEGIKAAITVGVGVYGGNLIGQWIQDYVNTISGTGVTGGEQGIDKYNAAAVSTDYTNTTVARGVSYGRPLSNDESKQIKTAALESEKQYYMSKPWQERYFAIDNPFSITGSLAAAIPSANNLPGMFSTVGSSLTSSFATMQGSLGNTFLMAIGGRQKVSAAEVQDFMSKNNYFGVPQWGFSPGEYNLMRTNADYSFVENGVWMQEHNANGELDAKYKKCYDPPANVDVPEECTADYLKTIEAFHWRIAQLQNSVLKQIGDTTISGNSGGGSGSGGSTIDSSLPQGSKEELIQKIKDSGNVSNANLLSTDMKQTILAVIARLSEKYKFTVNSTVRAGCGCPHANGSAIDLGNINGKGVPNGQDYAGINEDADNFLKDAATLLPGKSWVGVPNDHYKEIANGIMSPKGGSSDLDTPATTKATGSHFHLNCAGDAP